MGFEPALVVCMRAVLGLAYSSSLPDFIKVSPGGSFVIRGVPPMMMMSNETCTMFVNATLTYSLG